MRQIVEQFLEDLKAAHGENLVSVIQYGAGSPVASGENGAGPDLLVVLGGITPEDLRNAHSAMREWTKLGCPVPVYFTAGELRNGSDVFPIEFHFMQQARRVLFGEDILEGLPISDRNLRHQTEFELRSRLIRLRRKYIAASSSAGELYRLMTASLESFAKVFRAVLLVMDAEPPVRVEDVIAELCSRVGIEDPSFDKILGVSENEVKGPDAVVGANELFARYIENIEQIIARVDAV